MELKTKSKNKFMFFLLFQGYILFFRTVYISKSLRINHLVKKKIEQL